jgi:hypothetical protein
MNNFLKLQFSLGGQDSTVGIATRNVLEGPEPNPFGGETLCAVQSGPKPTYPLLRWVRDLLQE